jgi:hypothetical protein
VFFLHQECLGVTTKAANRGRRNPTVADRSDSIDVRREKSAEQKSLQASQSAFPERNGAFLLPGFLVFQPTN